MPLAAPTASLLDQHGVVWQPDVVLAKRTWWRTGGPADGVVVARDLATLQTVRRVATETDCALFVLGNASNLLISDKGVRGLVVQLAGELAISEPDDTDPPVIRCGAGLKLAVLLSRAAKRDWTGLECFAGIPGTLGGAVRMNAGASLGETKDCLIDVDVVLADGTLATLSREDLRMSYRTTHLPDGAVVAFARLQTTGADPEASRAAVKGHMDRRKATQPLDLPSCGSTFRNPPGDYAGRLIEAAGLKGHSIGSAQVSPKHANFIVNLGGARATDIRALIEHVQAVVKAEHGVELVREVHYAGDWSPDA